ncbi:MAG: hypothetical protein H7839_14910 [Magnetococcus sp. YQC-5]
MIWVVRLILQKRIKSYAPPHHQNDLYTTLAPRIRLSHPEDTIQRPFLLDRHPVPDCHRIANRHHPTACPVNAYRP